MRLLNRPVHKHDAMTTVKKKHLLFMPINGTRNSKGQSLPTNYITRQHQWRCSTRDAFNGTRPIGAAA